LLQSDSSTLTTLGAFYNDFTTNENATEPSSNATESPSNATEPSSNATEPSSWFRMLLKGLRWIWTFVLSI
jgi:hypothetical protein